MKKNNISRKCLGTVPDPLERLSLYNNRLKEVRKKQKSQKKFNEEVTRKSNKTVSALNHSLKPLNESFAR